MRKGFFTQSVHTYVWTGNLPVKAVHQVTFCTEQPKSVASMEFLSHPGQSSRKGALFKKQLDFVLS